MRKLIQLTGILLAALILACGFSYLTDKNRLGQWTITYTGADLSEPAWIPFFWAGTTMNNRLYERSAMYIPAKIEGLPYTFAFQFDLGVWKTTVYEKNIGSVLARHPEADRISNLKSPLQFWNRNKAFKNLTLDFGNMKSTTPNCALYANFGEALPDSSFSAGTPVTIGTIGTDLFQEKVLLIDYPNQRFAVCDSVPSFFKASLLPYQTDALRRVILPMHLKGKRHRVLYDNGSSLFSLITSPEKIGDFTTEGATDTLMISSWGKLHPMDGRPMKEPFQLAGRLYSNVVVYTDHREGHGFESYDAVTGNALFWNSMLLVDFRNKKFGLQER